MQDPNRPIAFRTRLRRFIGIPGRESFTKAALAGAAWRRVRLVVVLLLAAMSAGYLNRLHYYLEYPAHFQFFYFVLSVLAACALLGLRKWRWLLVSLVAVALSGSAVVPWYWPHAEGRPTGPAFRVMVCNVLTDNQDVWGLREEINSYHPDVIALTEVDSWWVAFLELREDYPFALEAPRDDNFGIALYSKLPLRDERVKHFGSRGIPSIVATMEVAGREALVMVTHPLPPRGGAYTEDRNGHLADVGAFVGKQTCPVVLAGDLNISMWTYHYRRLEEASGLVNTRRGTGILPTWPSWFYPFALPIDHCLVSRNIAVLDCWTGRQFGSDHLPLFADLALIAQDMPADP